MSDTLDKSSAPKDLKKKQSKLDTAPEKEVKSEPSSGIYIDGKELQLDGEPCKFNSQEIRTQLPLLGRKTKTGHTVFVSNRFNTFPLSHSEALYKIDYAALKLKRYQFMFEGREHVVYKDVNSTLHLGEDSAKKGYGSYRESFDDSVMVNEDGIKTSHTTLLIGSTLKTRCLYGHNLMINSAMQVSSMWNSAVITRPNKLDIGSPREFLCNKVTGSILINTSITENCQINDSLVYEGGLSLRGSVENVLMKNSWLSGAYSSVRHVKLDNVQLRAANIRIRGKRDNPLSFKGPIDIGTKDEICLTTALDLGSLTCGSVVYDFVRVEKRSNEDRNYVELHVSRDSGRNRYSGVPLTCNVNSNMSKEEVDTALGAIEGLTPGINGRITSSILAMVTAFIPVRMSLILDVIKLRELESGEFSRD